jgi:hypothetical protein
MKILYLKETLFEATLYANEECFKISSVQGELNKLATKYLFSIASYKSCVKKKLPLKNKIPIYFSNQLLFFYLKTNEEKYYLNYFEIFKICCEEKAIIIFKNGHKIELDISKKIILNEIKKVKLLLNYINNLF